MAWVLEQGSTTQALAGRASACLEQLRTLLPAQADELWGIAEGADVSPTEIVVLNGLGDRPSAAALAPPDGGTLIYFLGERGPLLGLTWELPAHAADHVRMLRIPPKDGRPAALCLTLTGCLGAVGFNERGVVVATTALYGRTDSPGLPWTALVRAMLERSDARLGKELLSGVSLCGGRFFVVADESDYFGVEHAGSRAVLTQLGPRAAHLHANHCFDPVLRKDERIFEGSTSHHRLNLASTLYAQRRPRDAEALWTLLHADDGSAGRLSVDPSPTSESTARATCATMVLRREDGWLRVVRGAAHRNPPLELSL